MWVPLLAVLVGCASSDSSSSGTPLASRATSTACPQPSGPEPVKLAVLIKTSVHYWETRLRHVLSSWATLAEAVLIASDAPLPRLPPKYGIVVVPDGRVDRDARPCVPAYRMDTVRNVHGEKYQECGEEGKRLYRRSLSVRLMVALEVLHDCLPTASILVADDDTFVPRSLLKGGGPLQGVDPGIPQLLGVRNPSKRFVEASVQKHYETTHHCGGGGGMYLTRGWLEENKKAGGPGACLTSELFVSDHDDVLLGTCSSKLLGVNCEFPPKPYEKWCCHARDIDLSLFRTPKLISRCPGHKCGQLMGPFTCIRSDSAVSPPLGGKRHIGDEL